MCLCGRYYYAQYFISFRFVGKYKIRHGNEQSMSGKQADKFEMCNGRFQRFNLEKFGIHSNL